jgi:hypothetical protein
MAPVQTTTVGTLEVRPGPLGHLVDNDFRLRLRLLLMHL